MHGAAEERRHALRWISGGLQRVVRQLRADPAWSVGPPLEHATAHILWFVYDPDHRAYEVHALRAHPDRWPIVPHIVPQHPGPAARPA